MAAPATARPRTKTGQADPGAEFDAFEAQSPEARAAEDRPQEATGAGEAAPAPLTLRRLVPELETITHEGRAYELRLLPHLSVGRQTALINHRNATLVALARERDDEELTPDEEEANRFHYRKIARAALPDLPQDALDALTLEQLEAVASRFFTRSQEARARALAAAGRPTSVS